MAGNEQPTLTGDDYRSEEVYALERERIFHRGWCYVGRADTLGRGGRLVVDIAGESVLVSRNLDGTLHAHANVCRHRGARLCDTSQREGGGSIMCPYHAWTYSLDGRLVATPRLGDDEVDRSALGLWPYAVDEWQGFVFVSLARQPVPLSEWLVEWSPELFDFAELDLGHLRTARRTETPVAANWKIIVENYQECLHCALVHPELVDLVPLYRTGLVVDPERADGAVVLANGGTSFTATGHSSLPILSTMHPGDVHLYRGCTVLPNMFVDVTATSVIVSSLFPAGPGATHTAMEYLVEPSADDGALDELVEFSELVGRQDYEVCERVQLGVSSRAFEHGVLTPKDDLVVDITQRYLAMRHVGG
jgi:Rieske 2Fe-2S family protein